MTKQSAINKVNNYETKSFKVPFSTQINPTHSPYVRQRIMSVYEESVR